MNICIIGTGYVGLVTGTCFAEMGNQVICVDSDIAKIHLLKQGIIPIYEPGLQEMVENNLRAGRLQFTNSLKEGVANAAFCFIAVGTRPVRMDRQISTMSLRLLNLSQNTWINI